jgi:hypothetical protein
MSTPVISLNSSPETWIEVHLARVGLGIGDELRDRRCGKRRIDHHHQRHPHDGADRRDVAQKLEAGLVVEAGVDRVVHAEQGERVAVGGRVGDRLEGKIARGAGPVLDDELPAEPLRQPLPHQARHDVLAAACGQPDDQPYGPGWVGLRARDARAGRQRGRAGGKIE